MFEPHGHLFWWLVTAAVVLWYSFITIYVAIRGTQDVREMLKNLSERKQP
jgi:hypothetical protein